MHAASTQHTLAACFPRGHVQHPFPPASWRPLLWHWSQTPCVCAGSHTRELCQGTLTLAHSHLCLLRVHSLPYPRVPPNTPGRAGAHTRPGEPPRTLSACPSARGSVVVNAAFDGGRICCVRSERAAIIWKAEIRNTIYSAALWKQFPALYNPILGQPPGAGQITIGYSLSSPGTKISRPR